MWTFVSVTDSAQLCSIARHLWCSCHLKSPSLTVSDWFSSCFVNAVSVIIPHGWFSFVQANLRKSSALSLTCMFPQQVLREIKILGGFKKGLWVVKRTDAWAFQTTFSEKQHSFFGQNCFSLFFSCGLQNQLKFPHAQISLHKFITSCPVGSPFCQHSFPCNRVTKLNLGACFPISCDLFFLLPCSYALHFSNFVNTSSWLNKSVSYVDGSCFSNLKMFSDAINYYHAEPRRAWCISCTDSRS